MLAHSTQLIEAQGRRSYLMLHVHRYCPRDLRGALGSESPARMALRRKRGRGLSAEPSGSSVQEFIELVAQGREGVHMPLDVRLSFNCCIHPQGSEVVARNPPICLRVCRLMHTSP